MLLQLCLKNFFAPLSEIFCCIFVRNNLRICCIFAIKIDLYFVTFLSQRFRCIFVGNSWCSKNTWHAFQSGFLRSIQSELNMNERMMNYAGILRIFSLVSKGFKREWFCNQHRSPRSLKLQKSAGYQGKWGQGTKKLMGGQIEDEKTNKCLFKTTVCS